MRKMCVKYARHYQRQRLASAPIAANSLGQFGADNLQLLWNLADHQATTSFGFPIEGNDPTNLSIFRHLPHKRQLITDAFEVSNIMKID